MQELKRILDEKYNWFDDSFKELLSMTLETKERDLLKEIIDTKEGIRTVLHDIEHHDDYDGFESDRTKHIDEVITSALSSYQFLEIPIKGYIDYEKIILEMKNCPAVDFVAHYKFDLFEPLDRDIWEKLQIEPDSVLVLYAKDLENKGKDKVVLRNIANFMRTKIAEEPELYSDYISVSYKVVNKAGLHARTASGFIQVSNSFKGDIRVGKLDTHKKDYANGKSIMGILTLGIPKGTRIEILCEPNKGDTESFYKAVEAITEVYEKGLPEERVFERIP